MPSGVSPRLRNRSTVPCEQGPLQISKPVAHTHAAPSQVRFGSVHSQAPFRSRAPNLCTARTSRPATHSSAASPRTRIACQPEPWAPRSRRSRPACRARARRCRAARNYRSPAPTRVRFRRHRYRPARTAARCMTRNFRPSPRIARSDSCMYQRANRRAGRADTRSAPRTSPAAAHRTAGKCPSSRPSPTAKRTHCPRPSRTTGTRGRRPPADACITDAPARAIGNTGASTVGQSGAATTRAGWRAHRRTREGARRTERIFHVLAVTRDRGIPLRNRSIDCGRARLGIPGARVRALMLLRLRVAAKARDLDARQSPPATTIRTRTAAMVRRPRFDEEGMARAPESDPPAGGGFRPRPEVTLAIPEACYRPLLRNSPCAPGASTCGVSATREYHSAHAVLHTNPAPALPPAAPKTQKIQTSGLHGTTVRTVRTV